MKSPDFTLLILASLVVAVVAFPLFIRRRADLFSTWNWVFYSVVFGVLLRAIYITFDLPSSDRIREVFLLDQSKDFLLWPMIVVGLALGVMVVGYLAGPHACRPIRLRVFETDQWNTGRFRKAAWLLIFISCLGLWFLVKESGELNRDTISRHRGISSELSEYRGHGALFAIIGLSGIACYLASAKIISDKRIKFIDIIIFMLSFGTMLFFYFFVSQRGMLMNVFVIMAALFYYLHGRRMRWSWIIIAGSAGLLLVCVMTILRPGGGGFSAGDDILENFWQLSGRHIANINGLDVSKTAHIMAAIPDRLDYQWGGTLFSIFYAWIPRELWPAKTFINPDTIIGQTIYGANVYGAGAVPPGLIAEMYWNFSWPGIILGCFVLGYFLRWIDTKIRSYPQNKNVIILYVTGFMSIGAACLGSSQVSILLEMFTFLLPLYVVLSFISKKPAGADIARQVHGH